jgi:hypothetical protein
MFDFMSPIRRQPLIALFVLAYAITWLGAIPFALGIFPVPMFPFGPLVAALVIAAVCGGRGAVKDLVAPMVPWGAAPGWYVYASSYPRPWRSPPPTSTSPCSARPTQRAPCGGGAPIESVQEPKRLTRPCRSREMWNLH